MENMYTYIYKIVQSMQVEEKDMHIRTVYIHETFTQNRKSHYMHKQTHTHLVTFRVMEKEYFLSHTACHEGER
jgi:hypothetical protein